MKRILIFLLFLSSVSMAQDTQVIKIDGLKKILGARPAKIHVINFWAMWCAPCIKELPEFEKLNASGNGDVKVTLINLDFADKIDKVNAFITKKKMKSEVVLLDEIDYNSWIDIVERSWNGAIPATLVINTETGKRKFVEKELAEGDLEKLIREVQ